MLQGSAADLCKLAMCAWDEWAAQQEQQQAGMAGQQDRATPIVGSSGGVRARLIAQIHGEQQEC